MLLSRLFKILNGNLREHPILKKLSSLLYQSTKLIIVLTPSMFLFSKTIYPCKETVV